MGYTAGSQTAGEPGPQRDDNDLLALIRSRPPQDAGRHEACEELVRRHAGIVRGCVARYRDIPEPAEDLMQVGYIGLMKAINGFDPAMGNSLGAYAQPCVSGEIKRYFRDKRWQMRVQRPAQELRLRIRAARSGCPLADPQPVAVGIAELEFASIGRLLFGAAKLGHDGADVPDEQPDQRVWPCVASVLGQEQPRPATRDRHERGAVGIEAVLPLLAESEALIPGHRNGGVGDVEDRDNCLVHGFTISLIRFATGPAPQGGHALWRSTVRSGRIGAVAGGGRVRRGTAGPATSTWGCIDGHA
jgi:RNA polymerase sigma factor (sigma-70 family)